MILFQEEYHWTPADAQSDVRFTFTCPDSVCQVVLFFSFSPGVEKEEAVCLPPVECALSRYYDSYPRSLQPMKAAQFLPVKNLVTISLDKDGRYLGNAHRWSTAQEHRFTASTAPRGFVPPECIPGIWKGMLHLHEIISPVCCAQLRIEGRKAYEMVSD